MNPLAQFAAFFQEGGPFMPIILFVGVAMLALTLERMWVLGLASQWNVDKLTHDLVEKVTRGDIRGAFDLASKVKGPSAQVAKAVLGCENRAEEKLLNAADGEAALVLPPLSRRLNALVLLANVATLLGLLGTIFGLITAFSAVGAADPSQRSSFLARGISQALNTTAFGLIIAVPGLIVHGFLVGRVERIVEQVDGVAVRLVRALARSSAEDASAAHAASAHAGRAASGASMAAPGPNYITSPNRPAAQAPGRPAAR